MKFWLKILDSYVKCKQGFKLSIGNPVCKQTREYEVLDLNLTSPIKFYISACTCGPMGCICHPFSLKAAQGKRRDKGTHKDDASTKTDKKEQTATKRETICKCGALGCGCAPLPGEETKRDDVPATSPHPVDVAIGWPFGYGPSFGWGPGPGVG